ncbi:rhodanese-like domain-containing protein [Cyanobium sp. Copco_Reservoir_LC18]|uniref:rhodanese-like domain-containing protein n=1 Tax=Cyanobium sp. Copco_Reservoir_LC18 TaxID=1328305 RepID=UPI00135BB4F6|nr:rhodanese-like domain-containing protein [Cyanobium sp. Copco_Reservoir_LC18]
MDEPTPTGTPRSLSAMELQRRLAEGEPLRIVDVREDRELEEARLPHPVVHLPLSRSGEWIPELETLLDRQQPVVVLCHAGIRSWHFACWLMQEQGYGEVWNLQGGIDAWSREVDPRVPRY